MSNIKYVLVPWPESQEYMDREWFCEEAVLHPTESSAYFIPSERLGIVENPALDWSIEDVRLQLIALGFDKFTVTNDDELFTLLEEFFEENQDIITELINASLQNKLLQIYGN